MTTPTPRPPRTPDLIVRFPVGYAWLLMAIGAGFAALGVAIIATTTVPGGRGMGEFIVLCGIAAVVGGNWWRQHPHEVARLTPRQLVLRREGIVKWEEISAIDKKEFTVRYRGSPTKNEFACIRLKTPRPAQGKLNLWLQRAKAAITGYDIIVPGNELDIPVDRFIEECRKRMPAPPAAP